MKPASTHTLQQEANAARALRDSLAMIPEIDTETIRDSIEGETNLHDAIAAVMVDINDDEMLVTGIDKMMSDLKGRRDRLEGRIDARKAAILKAMEIGEIQKLPTPSGTISLRNVPRALDVTDEKLIPWEYFTPQPPKLDRKKVKAALTEGKEIPGCLLDNGGVTISVRRA